MLIIRWSIAARTQVRGTLTAACVRQPVPHLGIIFVRYSSTRAASSPHVLDTTIAVQSANEDRLYGVLHDLHDDSQYQHSHVAILDTQPTRRFTMTGNGKTSRSRRATSSRSKA